MLKGQEWALRCGQSRSNHPELLVVKGGSSRFCNLEIERNTLQNSGCLLLDVLWVGVVVNEAKPVLSRYQLPHGKGRVPARGYH